MSAQESARPSDVVERARQAVDAWDRFAVWAPTRVPGVRVCLDLVRDLLAEVERLRTDLARMTERAEGAEVAWQDAETERDAGIGRVRAVRDDHATSVSDEAYPLWRDLDHALRAGEVSGE